MTDFLWGTPGNVWNLLTTELNSLAANSGSALGPEIDNTGLKYQLGRLELLIASNSLAFTTASYVRVLFLPRLSGGSNYPTYVSGTSFKLAQANYLSAIININPATQSSNVVREARDRVLIPQGYFKTVLVTPTGLPTLPSSGNTLNLIPTPDGY